MKPEDFDPGPLADVSSHDSGNRSTVVFVRELRHAPEKVWAALTDPKQLERWAPFVPDRNLAALGAATLSMTDGSSTETFPAKVTRVIAPTLLEYTGGEDLLIWELAPTARGTRLMLSYTVQAKDWMPKVAAGWHLCLVVAEHLIDGKPIGRIVGSDAKKFGWERLNDAYAVKLGVASTGWPAHTFDEKAEA
jgi:uncharacterized protein YndB with AHSA1/START domain